MADTLGTVFVHAGRAYELPPLADWPIAAVEKMQRGELSSALAELITEPQATQLLADGYTFGQFEDVLAQVSAAHAEQRAQAASPAESRKPARRQRQGR